MNKQYLEGLEAQVADLIFDVGAIKFGEFKLKLHETQPDAPLSPIFLMLRTAKHPSNPGPLTSGAMGLIGDLMAGELKNVEFNLFTGLPEAGEPFADEIEEITATWEAPPKRIYLEKVMGADGKRRIVGIKSGDYRPGDKVVIIDDLITQADTKLEAIEVLEAAGLEVVLVLVLVDRNQGGKQYVERAGYNIVAVLNLTSLLRHFVSQGKITSKKAAEVQDYITANQM